ncbi:MAG: GatB/YqeY domain-containing protein [Methylococcales bacterium]|nr:GatB/YqeY domain-containing protein [Methylococcales bacterium]
MTEASPAAGKQSPHQTATELTLYEAISLAMKEAMKARDKARLAVIRLMLAALKQKQIDEKIELADAVVLSVLDKMVKQRRESCRQYQAAGREDLAAQENAEIEVIKTFLPQPLSDAEIDQAIEAAIASSGASSMQDMGKVMALLREPMQGRADMAVISAKIKTRLGS